MIYKYGEQAIKDSLNALKIENHRKRESYVHKLLDYYNGSNTNYYIENRFDLDDQFGKVYLKFIDTYRKAYK